MVFIAGISPKTTIIDEHPSVCPICGLARAYYKRTDQYLTFFFIPIIKVKTGEPFIMCESCENSMAEFKTAFGSGPMENVTPCRRCGKGLQKSFMYCPYCGAPV